MYMYSSVTYTVLTYIYIQFTINFLHSVYIFGLRYMHKTIISVRLQYQSFTCKLTVLT